MWRWGWVLLVAMLSGCIPDVIVILTDDQRPESLAAMPTVQASLVGKGITFTRVTSPTPVCEPARATLLTGRLASHHGVQWVTGPQGGATAFVGADSQTLATELGAHGYATAMFGKYLNGYAAQGPPYTTSWYIPPGWTRWRAMPLPGYFNYDLVHEDGTSVHYGSAAADYSTDVLKTEATAWLSSVPATTPAFAWIAVFGPHLGMNFLPEPAPRHVGLYATLAPYRPASFNEADISDKPSWLQQFPVFDAETTGYVDEFRRKQYEAIQSIDELVAAVIATQKARGRYGQTLLMLIGDNALAWGEHRRVVVKGTAFEHDILVPCVVRVAGLTPRVETALLSEVDLLPSILGGLGYPIPPGLDGQDFSTQLQATGPGRTSAPLEGFQGAAGMYVGTRTATTTDVTYGTGEHEHYTLTTDPDELVSMP